MKVSDALLEIKQINETLVQISKCEIEEEDEIVRIPIQLSNQVVRCAIRYRGILEDRLEETNIDI